MLFKQSTLFQLHLPVVKGFLLFLTIFLFISPPGWAKPAVVYIGKVKDNPYNQSIHIGIQNFEQKTGCHSLEIETSSNASKYIPTLLQCIAKGYSPIIVPYSHQFRELMEIIDNHREIDFILLDNGEVDKANAYSFAFEDQEGSFMAGALAALMSKSKIVGFLYTSDKYPVLLRFRAGYIQGCQAVDPTVKVLEAQLGDYPEAWGDTAKSRKLAADMIVQGADVLFAAAGFAGTGMLAVAAEKKHVYAIGVDSNQNYLYPGTMIGSMIKHSDKAVVIALQLVKTGRRGVKRLGVAQRAVGIDFDGVAPGLVPEGVKQKLYELQSEILMKQRKIQKKIPNLSAKS